MHKFLNSLPYAHSTEVRTQKVKTIHTLPPYLLYVLDLNILFSVRLLDLPFH